MKTKFMLGRICFVLILLAAPVWAAEPSATNTPNDDEAKGKSLTELNKQLTNPISSLWSITFQQNNYMLDYMLDMGGGKPDHWNSNLNFQPVLPVALTEDWNLITRPVVTLFKSVAHSKPYSPLGERRTL